MNKQHLKCNLRNLAILKNRSPQIANPIQLGTHFVSLQVGTQKVNLPLVGNRNVHKALKENANLQRVCKLKSIKKQHRDSKT
jgi:hypothetical protein